MTDTPGHTIEPPSVEVIWDKLPVESGLHGYLTEWAVEAVRDAVIEALSGHNTPTPTADEIYDYIDVKLGHKGESPVNTYRIQQVLDAVEALSGRTATPNLIRTTPIALPPNIILGEE